jgi:hypothetical protein
MLFEVAETDRSSGLRVKALKKRTAAGKTFNT